MYSCLRNFNTQDTDSAIFTSRPGDYMPPCGDHLGDFTDEIATQYGVGARMTEFFACGAKNYGYKVQLADGTIKHELKVRGISLTHENCRVVNYNAGKQLALDFAQGQVDNASLPITFMQIKKVEGPIIVTAPGRKLYRAVVDKRVVLSDFSTIPYGYVLS